MINLSSGDSSLLGVAGFCTAGDRKDSPKIRAGFSVGVTIFVDTPSPKLLLNDGFYGFLTQYERYRVQINST